MIRKNDTEDKIKGERHQDKLAGSYSLTHTFTIHGEYMNVQTNLHPTAIFPLKRVLNTSSSGNCHDILYYDAPIKQDNRHTSFWQENMRESNPGNRTYPT